MSPLYRLGLCGRVAWRRWKNAPRIRVILALLISCPLLGGCEQIRGELSLTTHVVPLTISIDTQGQLSLAVRTGIEIPTPIGTLAAGVVIDPAEHFDVPKVLVVRLNGTDFFYDLHGQEFTVRVESGYYEVIRFSRQEQNLFIELQNAAHPGPDSMTLPIYRQTRAESDDPLSENFLVFTIEKIVLRATDLDVYVQTRSYISDDGSGLDEPLEISCLLEIYMPTAEVLGMDLPAGPSSRATYGALAQQTLETNEGMYRGFFTFSRDVLRKGGLYRFCLGCQYCSDRLPLP